MKEKNAFIFFNCDEEKSQKSMNVFYNKEIFRDLKVSRKALPRLKRSSLPGASMPKKRTSRPSAMPS